MGPRPMQFPATTFDRLRLDAQGRLDEDIRCAKCGYNLRAQSPTGKCPECSQPVAHTLWGYRLRYADPAWVARVASGFRWLEIGAITFLIGMMFVGHSPLYPMG